MGNRSKIDESEMTEYIIEGIPDPMLRDQARIQRLRTRASLLEALERVTLRARNLPSREQDARRQRGTGVNNKQNAQVKQCHNCDIEEHLAVDCPSKLKGVKCFGCGEFGHIAAKCPKNKSVIKEVSDISRSGYCNK